MQISAAKTLQQEFQKQKFKTEAEEAKWWFDNQDLLLKEFEEAAANGTLTRGTAMRRGVTPTTTIRLDPDDISKAKLQAKAKGLKYQTYLKMLIHESLQKVEVASSAPRKAKARA